MPAAGRPVRCSKRPAPGVGAGNAGTGHGRRDRSRSSGSVSEPRHHRPRRNTAPRRMHLRPRRAALPHCRHPRLRRDAASPPRPAAPPLSPLPSRPERPGAEAMPPTRRHATVPWRYGARCSGLLPRAGRVASVAGGRRGHARLSAAGSRRAELPAVVPGEGRSEDQSGTARTPAGGRPAGARVRRRTHRPRNPLPRGAGGGARGPRQSRRHRNARAHRPRTAHPRLDPGAGARSPTALPGPMTLSMVRRVDSTTWMWRRVGSSISWGPRRSCQHDPESATDALAFVAAVLRTRRQ